MLLAALGPAGPTIFRWHMGRPPIATTLAFGSLISILHSATGQIFLAFDPEAQVEALVKEEFARAPAIDAANH